MFDDKDLTQKEKRETLPNARKVREAATYHSLAQASVDDERGGRYAAAGRSTMVVGARTIQYPTQPANSPWHHDPSPPESPLGYSVEDQEPVGEMFERNATPVSVDQPPGDAGVGDGSACGSSDAPDFHGVSNDNG